MSKRNMQEKVNQDTVTNFQSRIARKYLAFSGYTKGT